MTPKGQSGEFNLAIYDGDIADPKVSCLVEFKVSNANEKNYAKDVLKLSNPKDGDEGASRFLINLLGSCDAGTEKSIRKKIVNAWGNAKKQLSEKVCPVTYLCYSIKQKERDPLIILNYPKQV